MTIRDPAKFVQSMWDWAVLRGCFGQTRIEPTDLDGAVERNGRLLILETKLPNVALTTGQRIAFEQLAANGFVTIFVIWGNPGQPEQIRIFHGRAMATMDCTLDYLKAKVSGWFQWACTQAPPIQFGNYEKP